MQLNTENIEFSKYDRKRDVLLPTVLTPDLAELTGIMLGDGNIYVKDKRYEMLIAGDAKLDIAYHQEHIVKLWKKIFNVSPLANIRTFADGRKCAIIKMESKAIARFFTEILHLPNGRKHNVEISETIKKAGEECICRFLKGIADTDFTIYFKNRLGKKNCYPKIEGHFSDKRLVEQLQELFAEIGINSSTSNPIRKNKTTNKEYQGYRITITGKKSLESWMNKIGFANDRHLIKYRVWQRLGYCPPYTTIEKGEKILKE